VSDQTADELARVEAVAEAWASIDGKLEGYFRCKADRSLEDVEGYYLGYIAEAGELIRRIERRGYTLVPCAVEQPDG
jgi:hypothetical protein